MKNLILTVLLLGTTATWAKTPPWKGFIEVRPGHSLYVEHHPATSGRPTLFLANGLTFDTSMYSTFAAALKAIDPGVGLVLWDMVGMGKTLVHAGPVKGRITFDDQVEDLRLLREKMNLPGPLSLAGLSYGGAIALHYATKYPDDFENYIPIAPMLERLPDQDMWVSNMARWHIMYVKLLPFNVPYFYAALRSLCAQQMASWHLLLRPRETRSRVELIEHYQKILYSADWSDRLFKPDGLPDPDNFEEVYDYYLRVLIFATYWIPEPTVLENPLKLEAVFRMVQGVKEWNAFKAAGGLPTKKIHALAALQDEHVKQDRMDAFWEAVPPAAKASYLRLHHSRHKITNEWPIVTAQWALQILAKPPELQKGLTFNGNPITGEATSGSTRIPLKKEGHCESLLREVPEPR